MSTTTIEWATHTFNPWSGCAKISAGCAHCYAAALPPRMRRGAAWGLEAERQPATDAYWRQPLGWARAAARAGVRPRVFCASTADVFEGRGDLDPLRIRLWALIKSTPELDWLLLTKRPARMALWAREHGWPANAWAGASIEDQAAADARLPHLLAVPARVRFVSCEPLLGPVDLEPWLDQGYESNGPAGWMQGPSPIHWIIVGGESGPRARPMRPAWARRLQQQAHHYDVAFFFKQWGEWAPPDDIAAHGVITDFVLGGAIDEGVFAQSVWVDGQGFAVPPEEVYKVGKARAGRLLDGQAHDALPVPR